MLGIIGPNGAGKTSLVNAITGVYPVSKGGSITFSTPGGTAHDLVGPSASRIAKLGVARTFQNLGLIEDLTIQENLVLGADVASSGYGWLRSAGWTPRVRRVERSVAAAARAMAARLELSGFEDAHPADVPYGMRKRADLGRVLLMRPRLLILDEPLAGMSAGERSSMMELIGEVKRQEGLSLMFIEHDVSSVMDVSDRVLALDAGSVLLVDTPDVVRADERVKDSYLGRDADEVELGIVEN